MSKFYVSKYAATRGIFDVDSNDVVVPINGDRDSDNVFINGKLFTLGKDIHASLDAARVDAIRRTRRKVGALVKKEAKLEDLISTWESELPV